jgi:hypothetical protein
VTANKQQENNTKRKNAAEDNPLLNGEDKGNKVDAFTVRLEPKPYVYGVSRRTGAIGIKQGMATYFDAATGESLPATIIFLDTNQTLLCRSDPTLPAGKAIQEVGAGMRINPRNASPSMQYYYRRCGVPVKSFRETFIVSEDAVLPPGNILSQCYMLIDTRFPAFIFVFNAAFISLE